MGALASILRGQQAFYNQPDYLQNLEADVRSDKVLDTVNYRIDIPNETPLIVKICKIALSIILLPLYGLYIGLCALTCKIILLSSSALMPYPNADKRMFQICDETRRAAKQAHNPIDLKFKRITVEVNGSKIDGMIIGTPETLATNRWVLKSKGNACFYEDLDDSDRQMVTHWNTNLLVFNYAGVGASEGFAWPKSVVNSYKAMLRFLEDEKEGLGAKEIIGYGHSIGGGVQGEALRTHQLDPKIKYVFIKDRSFSTLYSAINYLMGSFLASVAGWCGWELNSLESSKKLQCPEIVLQPATVSGQHIEFAHQLLGDEVIGKEASLGYALKLEDEDALKPKYCMASPMNHSDPIIPSDYTKTLEAALKV